MNKLVNVYPSSPIISINPPIRTRLNKINMSTENIRKCLISNAYVEEILNGNKTIKLTFDNYDKDNDTKVEVQKPTQVVQPKPVEPPKKVEEPKPVTNTKVDPAVEDKKVSTPIAPHVEEPKVEAHAEVEESKTEGTKDETVSSEENNETKVEDSESAKDTTEIETTEPVDNDTDNKVSNNTQQYYSKKNRKKNQNNNYKRVN